MLFINNGVYILKNIRLEFTITEVHREVLLMFVFVLDGTPCKEIQKRIIKSHFAFDDFFLNCFPGNVLEMKLCRRSTFVTIGTWILFLLWRHFVCAVEMLSNTTSVDILDKLFEGYDNRLPPSYFEGNATLVLVQMYILTVDSVNEASMDYKLSMFLRQRWNDRRLAHAKTGLSNVLELDTRMMTSLWVPDMYILTEKRAQFHYVTVPNKLMHIYPNGDVQYSMRVTGTFSCPMQLVSFPFDKQNCKLEVESYGYSTNTLLFRWHETEVTKSDSVALPQYDLTKLKSYVCDRPYYGILFTCLGVHFTFERSYGYYVIQIYIPSILIVILSWVNFWLDCEATPARITLGLLTVLTMTTQLSGARANLPRVSYVKAIDVWMAVCLGFVFAGLVEFAFVNVFARKERRKKTTDQDPPQASLQRNSVKFKGYGHLNGSYKNHDNHQQNEITSIKESSTFACFKNMAGLERARVLDKVSRVVFPVVFVLFNIAYWIYYLLLPTPGLALRS